MPQEIWLSGVDGDIALRLPDPDEEALPGVPWGRADELMTPAYWKGQCWQAERLGWHGTFRLGADLREEVAACMLGGWGMPAELGLAAFRRLRDRGLLRGPTSAHVLEAALSEPLVIGNTRRRYRFPRQRAAHLSGCLSALEMLREPEGDREVRDALIVLPGVGWKTASWVVRNHRASSAVAIIDVHVVRAGVVAGVFDPAWTPERNYRELEQAFLDLADAMGVRAALLDAVIWEQMRRFGNLAIEAAICVAAARAIAPAVALAARRRHGRTRGAIGRRAA
ncbi:hypothetical protein [Falsiroseomonas sp. HW251]|uniref:8-oxoguanine DNA glycosylase n=1 Tax=Falsiroseomonas sp. HW251 TaxID=3390998 RepID=UPI003D31617E